MGAFATNSGWDAATEVSGTRAILGRLTATRLGLSSMPWKNPDHRMTTISARC